MSHTHERDALKGTWGSKTARLSRDSFLPFGSCLLCQLPAREPVSCASHGHLFCRECAVSNLLAQNEELKRAKRAWERGIVDEAREREEEDARARARAVEDFERVQAGLSARGAGEKVVGREGGKVIVEQRADAGAKGSKRKFEMDEEELVRLAREDVEKTKRVMLAEEGAKPELPSFWVPSKIPDNQKPDRKAPKQHATCPASSPQEPHEFSLKGLVDVKFSIRDTAGKKSSESNEQPTAICPSCSKSLSNSTKAVLGKPCGHVLCKPCSDKFQSPPEKSAHDEIYDSTVRCYVCQEDVTGGRRAKKSDKEGKKDKKEKSKVERGLVELCCEGTGFAGGGKAEVKKSGIVYQC
ncbi:hypothetical protein MBLNU230_g7942t1 [Neophaeotheca triangularis]